MGTNLSKEDHQKLAKFATNIQLDQPKTIVVQTSACNEVAQLLRNLTHIDTIHAVTLDDRCYLSYSNSK